MVKGEKELVFEWIACYTGKGLRCCHCYHIFVGMEIHFHAITMGIPDWERSVNAWCLRCGKKKMPIETYNQLIQDITFELM